MQIKVAKSSPKEMKGMLEFFEGLESIMNGDYEDVGNTDPFPDEERILCDYINDRYEKFLSYSWHRFYWGFDTLLTVTDPSLSYLDFSPELKAIEVQQEHEKWHDLADDLPPEDGFYITYQLAYRATDIYEYNKEANVWNDGAFNIHPSHWKHLPPEPVVGKNE